MSPYFVISQKSKKNFFCQYIMTVFKLKLDDDDDEDDDDEQDNEDNLV